MVADPTVPVAKIRDEPLERDEELSLACIDRGGQRASQRGLPIDVHDIEVGIEVLEHVPRQSDGGEAG